VPLLHNLYLFILNRELKQSNRSISHELRGYGSTPHPRKPLRYKSYVLVGLHYPNLIVAALGLDWDGEMATVLIKADIEFVDFDLSNTFHRCAKVVLQAECGQAEECVDQTIRG
jgi:hypothetical protein